MTLFQKRLFSFFASATIVLIAAHCPSFPISSIMGNCHWHFALLPVMAPLVGALCGPLALIGFLLLWIIRFPWTHLAEVTLCRLLLALHLPTVGATWFCSTTQKIRSTIPLLCMLFFWLHPTGAQAWGYALYWLIPLAVALMPKPNFILTALASSFTAHAVGSILWLYGGLLTRPEAWIALIPQVWIERMIMTLFMVIGYLIWQIIINRKFPSSSTAWSFLIKTRTAHQAKEAA